MNTQPEIHQKSINNAVAAYLMILISGAFLLSNSNEYLKNDFVKSHTKIAFIIHIGFLITGVVFIGFDFLKEVTLIGINLNTLLAGTIFTGLFMFLLYGMYSATKGKIFKTGDIISIPESQKIFDINGDSKVDEKDLVTYIIAHIPFIGYIVNGYYHKVKPLKNIVLLNMIISIMIMLIFVLGNNNVALLFGLFYIIFIVFSSINILVKTSLIGINITFIPTPEDKIIILKTLIQYSKNYFGDKSIFIGFIALKNKVQAESIAKEKKLELLLVTKKTYPLPSIFLYIPIVNFINFAWLNSKYNIHIINGIYISLVAITIFILSFFGIITVNWVLFLLFPICFGIGYTNSRIAYRMPYIYTLHEGVLGFINIFKRSKKTLGEKHKEEHEVLFSVGKDGE